MKEIESVWMRSSDPPPHATPYQRWNNCVVGFMNLVAFLLTKYNLAKNLPSNAWSCSIVFPRQGFVA